MRHLAADSPRRAELPQRQARGREALAVMEGHLQGRSYFVAERYTIADIALYAYTHVAEEGGLELRALPAGARLAGAGRAPAALCGPAWIAPCRTEQNAGL